ncbi:MAG TPA: gamma carbonic anhydrase family protein [Acidobacteriota bacterium]|nr:gamma carbonic anhydrase family protein [Acidobacteriota bacterium]
MALYEFEGKRPVIGEGTYVAETADVIGEVRIGQRCFIGPGARIKGDYGSVVIGDETSIQENCVIHARPGEKCTVGNRCTVGHGSILHNCTLEDGVVIGMGAIVSDWAVVRAGSLVGEGAVVPQSSDIPPHKVAVGVPARVTGDADESVQEFRDLAPRVYVALAQRYGDGLKKL